MAKDNVAQQKSFAFALEIIKLYQRLVADKEFVLSKQLLRSGTSIGANIEEAVAAQSRKDFLPKMSIASKEARETRYWLRLLAHSELAAVNVEKELEAVEELTRILIAIVKTTGQA